MRLFAHKRIRQTGHIRGVQTQNDDAMAVVIDSAGQLGTQSSSGRLKEDIKPMDKASEAILELKPVTFQYKTDSRNSPEFDLIAEEVAKVNPNLVAYQNGEIYTVRYDAVNAMLLKPVPQSAQEDGGTGCDHCRVKEIRQSRHFPSSGGFPFISCILDWHPAISLGEQFAL